ncbi:MAG: TetR/AcrR family transcriptional regulator [Proteobacteria bacterium]|nr:TetR/AcrR family transcriptional regulator [Pseudomonadota bacterium]
MNSFKASPAVLPAGKTEEKTWQQTKSENTRGVILEATLDCFYELGYPNTTTEKVAKRARVSRGAMLHHFPSRMDLIRAAVSYIHQKRLAIFTEQYAQVNEGAQYTLMEEGIDAYWEQLNLPVFVVFHELQIASRTDPDLAEILRPAKREFDASWAKISQELFPDLALSEEFDEANLLTLYLLEGMAIRGDTRGRVPELMIPWLKKTLRQMFADVREIDRQTASQQLRETGRDGE